ncbi:glutamic acid-rich protein-like [Chenopodium quinoa]|uniref:glutamic acid-rich protein-like n=1 Tax=Chenopodium quinoa TaxID=63459 RepID=UPI000B796140|nr:glutamic acid-rich protein-like [Chenopodium quinoa]
MAITKRMTRVTNSDDSSFYIPMSELSDRSPGAPSTLSDSILGKSKEVQAATPILVDMSGQEPAQSESSSDSESSSSSRHSLDSEERHSRLHIARESHAAEKGDDWAEPSTSQRELFNKAMEKITASKKAAALLRAAILGQKRPSTDLPSKEASKAMLRVYGLRRPIHEKTKEVKNQLEAAKKKNLELEKAVKDLQAQLQPLKHANHAAEELRKSNKKLKERLANQEAALTQQLSVKAESEKMALAQDMMEDSAAIMKMTWAALFPDSDYEQWESKFAAYTGEYNIKVMQQAVDEEEEKAEDEEEEKAEGEEEADSTSRDEDQEEDDEKEADANQEQALANVPGQENVLEEQAPNVETEKAAADDEVPPSNV